MFPDPGKHLACAPTFQSPPSDRICLEGRNQVLLEQTGPRLCLGMEGEGGAAQDLSSRGLPQETPALLRCFLQPGLLE